MVFSTIIIVSLLLFLFFFICLLTVIGLLTKTPTGPGEMGKAVVVHKDQEAQAKELFKINQFNLVASDMMSLNRSLPDYRMDG